MIQEKKKRHGHQSEVLEEERGIFQSETTAGARSATGGGTASLCTCRGVCRSGGGKMRNFPLVPSVFSEKGDEVIS